MSITRPATRSELKEYCLRALGKPVIEINVDDQQVEDRIEQALEYFSEYHFSGTSDVFLKHKITSSEIQLQSVSGEFAEAERVIGQTSGVSSIVKTYTNQGFILEVHTTLDGDGIKNPDSVVGYTVGETIVGEESGATATVVSFTAGDIDNGWIPVDDAIIGVTAVLSIIQGGTSSDSFFDVRYQMHLNEIFDLKNTNLQNYSMSMQYLSLLNELFTGLPQSRFNRHQNRLYIDVDWGDELRAGDIVVVRVKKVLSPTEFTDVYNDMFLKRYATALIKLQWGNNLKKFEGVQLPGGVTLNARAIYDEATQEVKEMEQEMSSRFELPVDFITG